MKTVRIVFMLLGFICLALGTIGVIIPILPTVPFYLATVFFSQIHLRNCITGLPVQSCIKSIWNPMCKSVV